LASPAAWLRTLGAEVTCVDLAVAALPESIIRTAGLIAFYLPMHTATRLAADTIPHVRALNPNAHLCAYGLYAPLNAPWLHKLGVQTLIGGEYEAELSRLCANLAEQSPDQSSADWPPSTTISLDRLAFRTPDRSGLPPFAAYAQLRTSQGDLPVGYTEASRGCKHLCRHCPIVPVYGGMFRVIPRSIVLADIRQQVASGARHISFGDPDFLNGPGHALPLVQELHAEFPTLTYDVIIKIEHLLKHADLLPTLRDTGCLFITSAVESSDDTVLARFDKQHTRADFVRASQLMREIGLDLSPTFVTFTPWTSRAAYCDLLALIAELDLIEHVAPIQYAIRLLIPAGSRLLELEDVQALIGPFDPQSLSFPWQHPDPAMDDLYRQVRRVVQKRTSRHAIFREVWRLANTTDLVATRFDLADKPIPHLSEPWYC
jgi:tRNA A37 methylthiotransferase MiaB